jgi:CrcB protein
VTERTPFEGLPRRTRPRLRSDLLGVVFVGGCVGGYARYVVVTAWSGGDGWFPWSTLTVNVVGAFVLAMLVVFVSEARPGRYLRPLVGTGFCGALTTFSSVVVSCDRLFVHQRVGVAFAYLAASAVGGLVAAALGLVVGRVAWADGLRRAKGGT